MPRGHWLQALVVTVCLTAAGCGDNLQAQLDAGLPPADDAAPQRDASQPPPEDGGADALPCPRPFTEDVSACAPGSTDYQPRDGTPGANDWPACISDDDTYHLIGSTTPSSVARSQAFEAMAPKLWGNSSTPSPDDFLSARDDYSVAEGLASRVARRQDISYPEVPGGDKFACQSAGIPEQYPDRCAGPAKLKPIIDDAFQKGSAQDQPRVQAARIEAALLWFFHLSLRSEVWTCGFSNIKDCDSAIAYYTQVAPRDEPVGLARYVDALGPETHDRIYDALLAARCWRDVDPALPATTQYEYLYDRAQAQLDRASLRGQALVLRDRIGRIPCATADEQPALVEFVKVLGGLLDHGASLVAAAAAARLKAYTDAPTADAAAAAAAQDAIDEIFACP
jgi:hypothetical protein